METTVTRVIIKYRQPYAFPARYTSCTNFVVETKDGERYEILCGNKYKNYKQFVKAMKERYGKEIKIDNSPPYVIYQ